LWNSLKRAGHPDATAELGAEEGGYFAGRVPEARFGMLYRFRLDSGSFPDPASRFQPSPTCPSQIIDPNDFKWTDANWRGVTREGQVIYELHIGTSPAKEPGARPSRNCRNWRALRNVD